MTALLACPFCRIVSGADPAEREVYRDQSIVTFFPTEPAALGHVLIIPRRHVESIWELTTGEASQLSAAVLKIAHAIRRGLLPEGLNIIQSNGEVATQTVRHLHIHVVPRWSDDQIGSIWPPPTHYSDRLNDDTLSCLQDTLKMPSNSLVKNEISADDRRKHLDHLQSVISRQSAASSATKGWLMPIITATFGIALTQRSALLAAVGLLAIILFAYMDAHYLQNERGFRELYKSVAQGQESLPPFTMDPRDIPGTKHITSKRLGVLRSYFLKRSTLASWSIAPFYGILLTLAFLLILVFSFCN